MYESLVNSLNYLIYVPQNGMVHPGLPPGWVIFVMFCMVVLTIYTIWLSPSVSHDGGHFRFQMPLSMGSIKPLITKPWLLLGLRIFTAMVFLLVIYAGLFGTPVPERNFATVLTWTVWWSGVVISIFFVGSAWCAICPWDTIASWLIKRKLWKRGDETTSLNKRVPRIFRSVWPALLMFIGLTWLELGAGVTVSPYATAVMALLMVVLATVSLAVYERKAFCRYFCAIGRTIGAYSSMSPVALRPINENICAECRTLECYHGNQDIDPCPTHLVMGRITQNTYCTSCGSCSLSCPYQNISWQLRGIGDEITYASRPHLDEAWFILGLMALTVFHGFTMMPYWEDWMKGLAYTIGDSGRLLTSFSIGMLVCMMIPVLLYLVCIYMTKKIAGSTDEIKRIFSSLAFSILPLAFTYHIAHNLTHLFREIDGFWSVVANPLGVDTLPRGYICQSNTVVMDNMVFALKGLLVMFGFWLSLRIAKQRMGQINLNGNEKKIGIIPIMVFIITISLLNLWLLMQPMVMRM